MITVVCFINNLRLQDNYCLNKALSYPDPIFPIILNNPVQSQKKWFGWPSLGPFRQAFLTESIIDLKHALKRIGLFPWETSENTLSALKIIQKKYNEFRIIMPYLLGYYEQCERDALIEFANHQECSIEFVWDHTLIEKMDVSTLSYGFSGFRKKVEKNMQIKRELPPLTQANGIKHDLEDTVLKPNPDIDLIMPGGETAAHNHLNEYIWQTKSIHHYKQTRNKLIGKHVSSKFSFYLSHGCLSARQIYHNIKRYEQEFGKNISTYWLVFELLWRDFFQFQCLKNQDHWFSFGGIQQKSWAPPNVDQDQCHAWATGQTSNAFINAAMIELKSTGFMSNRGRQNAASYLIHDLGQDWRLGAAIFEHFLIDYDVASNIGNWMMIAGVGNSAQSKVFNVDNQRLRYDKNGKFTNFWTQPKLF